MRAAVCREFGRPLVIEDVSLDAPGPEEVLIDVAACAICHSDISYMNGAWGGELPAIYGHEAAGVVAAVGEGVDSLQAGDAVAITLVRSCGSCFYCSADASHLCRSEFRLNREPPIHDAAGAPILQAMSTAAFAEQVLVHVSQVAPVPAGISMESAALLACGVVTGFGAVTRTAAVPTGASVVVVGTGGVGLNCIQGAVYCGAGDIIAIDVRDEKLEMARRLGATATVNAAATDAAEAVRDLTGGRGADYVFIAVGSARALEQAIAYSRPGGTVTIVGMPPTGDHIVLDASDFAASGRKLLGSRMGSVRVAEDIPALASIYADGRLELDGLISGRYPLDSINEAIASAASGEAIRNVITF